MSSIHRYGACKRGITRYEAGMSSIMTKYDQVRDWYDHV